jgi:hypothetical protein
MAPQELQLPGTRPTEKGWLAVDERILAHRAQHPSPTDQEHQGTEERNCFYCLEGWVFLGSLDHDGEEIVETIRCRRCGDAGRAKSS